MRKFNLKKAAYRTLLYTCLFGIPASATGSVPWITMLFAYPIILAIIFMWHVAEKLAMTL